MSSGQFCETFADRPARTMPPATALGGRPGWGQTTDQLNYADGRRRADRVRHQVRQRAVAIAQRLQDLVAGPVDGDDAEPLERPP